MKQCSKCSRVVPVTEYYVSARDGVGSRCKECIRASVRANADNAKVRAYRAESGKHRVAERQRLERNILRTDSEIASARTRLRPNNLKTCRICKNELPFFDFRKHRGLTDGLNPDCNQCAKEHRLIVKESEFKERGLTECVYCGNEWQHRDHVMPVALGGKTVTGNLVPSCAPCNQAKNKMHPIEWMNRAFPTENYKEKLDSWGIDYSEWTN